MTFLSGKFPYGKKGKTVGEGILNVHMWLAVLLYSIRFWVGIMSVKLY